MVLMLVLVFEFPRLEIYPREGNSIAGEGSDGREVMVGILVFGEGCGM